MAVVESVEGLDQWVRIKLAGEIDIATAELITQSITATLEEYGDARVLEFDLSDVTLVDSTGVGLLVTAHRELSGRGVKLIVTNAAKIVERVMRVTGVFELLTGATTSTRQRGRRS